jgi:hypothetical protein
MWRLRFASAELSECTALPRWGMWARREVIGIQRGMSRNEV